MALKIRAIIDGDTYSERQLDNIQYEREKRTLQEMIHLGASVNDGGTELTYDDINYLSKADAKRLLRETKERIGFLGAQKLYEKEMARCDQMWRDIVKDFDEADPMQTCVADIEVEGLSLQELGGALQAALGGEKGVIIRLEPDHFEYEPVEGEESQKCGMEVMGMFGGPNVVVTVNKPELASRVVPAEGYHSTGCGTSQLMDGTCRQDIAFHQIKPTENGLLMKSCVYFPKNTPQELVDGHKVHLAIETMEIVRMAYQNKLLTESKNDTFNKYGGRYHVRSNFSICD